MKHLALALVLTTFLGGCSEPPFVPTLEEGDLVAVFSGDPPRIESRLPDKFRRPGHSTWWPVVYVKHGEVCFRVRFDLTVRSPASQELVGLAVSPEHQVVSLWKQTRGNGEVNRLIRWGHSTAEETACIPNRFENKVVATTISVELEKGAPPISLFAVE